MKRRRQEPSNAIPEHLRVGSSLQLASFDEWLRQRLAFMSEVGRDGLLALGTSPVEWVIECVEVRKAVKG
ncbi:hypothetical protein SCMU_27810 [Sinomonas cyclohexanicum]|uniref:Uncharacterized protein n=1 Tax=Sinomonas cyclohexanicum TaxID=322009 RepID=A0ABN6FJT7_SINCY|nr:hypothetical protein SCMU_27810 [Corynebacterium cyclohexanicum]